MFPQPKRVESLVKKLALQLLHNKEYLLVQLNLISSYLADTPQKYNDLFVSSTNTIIQIILNHRLLALLVIGSTLNQQGKFVFFQEAAILLYCIINLIFPE